MPPARLSPAPHGQAGRSPLDTLIELALVLALVVVGLAALDALVFDGALSALFRDRH